MTAENKTEKISLAIRDGLIAHYIHQKYTLVMGFSHFAQNKNTTNFIPKPYLKHAKIYTKILIVSGYLISIYKERGYIDMGQVFRIILGLVQ